MGQTILIWLGALGSLASIGQFIYTALVYHRGGRVPSQDSSKPKFPYGRMVFFLVLTWGAVAFNYYDRHHTGDCSHYKSINVLQTWGTLPEDRFQVSIETKELISEADRYYLMLMARVVDNQIDQAFDELIEKSEAFLITGEFVSIEVRASEASLSRLKVKGGGMVQYFVVLVPHAVARDKIRRLADVELLGGRLVGARSQIVRVTELTK